MILEHGAPYFAAFLLPPLIGLIVWVRGVMRRQRQAEQSHLPFDPAPEPPPNVFFRRFPAPERAYLREQLKPIAAGTAYLTWIFAFILMLPLLAGLPTGHWTNPAVFAYRNFLDGLTGVPMTASFFIGFGCLIVVIPMRGGGYAVFHRTRPLSLSFLFWARALPCVGAFFAACALAIAIAFGVFLALHGPVWQHLPHVIPCTLGPDDADAATDYQALLATTLPRFLLSLFTTLWLYVGVAMAIFCIPSKPSRGPVQKSLFALLFLIILAQAVLNMISDFTNLTVPRWLFVYTSGPPPAWGFALVPFALGAALILLASRLIRRTEL